MGTQCCAFGCTNTGGHRFPKDAKLRKAWIVRINRKNFKPSPHAVVCHEHFVEEDYISINAYGVPNSRRTLKKTAVPSKFSWKKKADKPGVGARAMQREAERALDAQIQGRLSQQEELIAEQVNAWIREGEEQLKSGVAPEPAAFEDLASSTEADTTCDTVTCPGTSSSELAATSSIYAGAPSTEATEATEGTALMDTAGEDAMSGDGRHVGVQCDVRAGYIDVTRADGLKDVKKLCGLDADTFKLLLNIIRPYYDKCQPKRFSQRALGFQNSVLLTVMKLRHNMTTDVLSVLFDVSRTSAGDAFRSTVHILSTVFGQIEKWPVYREVGKPTVIIDCTEVKIDRPADPTLQSDTYSTYKGHNTIKVLIGITPDGGISFVSDAFAGSTSDQKIFVKCGIAGLLSPGDIVMADRGFNVQDYLATKDVRLVTPAFLKGKQQLTGRDRLLSRAITKERIHVERVIGLTKTFTFLNGPIDFSYVPIVSEIFHACCFLCMLQPTIV